jgi:asparagine synthase (glutamine-hydrolysing)
MCGIAGVFNVGSRHGLDDAVLKKMTEKLMHRGPDDCKYFITPTVGFGFRRLSLVDLAGGAQPMFNEDRSIVSMCNGEIFNYEELKKELIAKGHKLVTRSDCEVIPHLYEEYGSGLLQHLNGQFALAIFDSSRNELCVARDHVGINPLFYTFVNGVFIFASEIKAILEHPLVPREVDLVGLDQSICFPGLISPRTMFRNVSSLKSGCYVRVNHSGMKVSEYWDLEYPTLDEQSDGRPESYYVEQLTAQLLESVSLRLKADVPAGVYLSGGLDSSLVAGMAGKVAPHTQHETFSISFEQDRMCESAYQRKVAERLRSSHHEIPFGTDEIIEQMERAVYHAECPLKESYNTACLALARSARAANTPVILTGQGADELFAGYIGYRFDKFHLNRNEASSEHPRERQLRRQLWGDESLMYDNNYAELEALRSRLYSDAVNDGLRECNAFSALLVNPERLVHRHAIHQRSYLDFKFRLSDHLLAEHGDRMAMAHGVELRHPLLDISVLNCAVTMPPELKLHGYTEKYILKQVARPFVDAEIVEREKFGWYAPGSPVLIQRHSGWMEDLLCEDKIRNVGFFNPATIRELKKQYSDQDFELSQPFESDLLMIVLTFNILLEKFHLSMCA